TRIPPQPDVLGHTHDDRVCTSGAGHQADYVMLTSNSEVKCCNQAIAQACAVCSPKPGSMSEIAMFRQLGCEAVAGRSYCIGCPNASTPLPVPHGWMSALIRPALTIGSSCVNLAVCSVPTRKM